MRSVQRRELGGPLTPWHQSGNVSHDRWRTGQSPIGELVAVPGASQLDLAVCLLDVDDRSARSGSKHAIPAGGQAEAKETFNGWARWHRRHASDPAHQPEVITEPSAPDMRWERWRSWTRTDPRWKVTTIDSSEDPVDATASKVRDWVGTARGRRDDGSLPLRRGWLG